jgi:hypothetical protein
MMMAGASGAAMRRAIESPSSPGIIRSSTTRSNGCAAVASARSMLAPSSAVSTAKPCLPRNSEISARMPGSSSTTRRRAISASFICIGAARVAEYAAGAKMS